MDFTYKILRSKRRTIALAIKPDGQIIVRAPKFVSEKQIDSMVKDKQAWIFKHLAKLKQLPRASVINFSQDDKFLFLGQQYGLIISDSYFRRLNFDGEKFILSSHFQGQAKQLFRKWYKAQAQKIIKQRVDYYAEKMGISYKSLSITSAKTRWGSCSSQQTLNFSFRLIMAPLEIIDYVAVHELAHILHHNHSKKFWYEVKKYYPNFKTAKQWLSHHRLLLEI